VRVASLLAAKDAVNYDQNRYLALTKQAQEAIFLEAFEGQLF